MRGLTIAVHFLVLARHRPEDTSPVVVLVAVLITLVIVVLARLGKHDVGTRQPQARADLKRPMLTAAELRLIDFTSLPMSPASATNEELRKIRVKGGARTWQFLVKGYSHTTTCGPVPRYMLYKLLREGDGLRLIRSLHNPHDADAIHVASEAGELAGVDLGFVPREIASELAPLLDAGAEFYAVVQRVAIDDQINGFPKLYVYLRLVVHNGPATVVVPKAAGLTQAAPTEALTGAGLVLRTEIAQSSSPVAAGNVINESPVAGTSVNFGSAVHLTVSSGPARVSVPNAVGTQAAAATATTGAGLVKRKGILTDAQVAEIRRKRIQLGTVAAQPSSMVPAGSVITQDPTAGTRVNFGSAVSLVASSGPTKVSVPNVVGMTRAAAITAIMGHGLVRRKRIQVGTVTAQSSSTVAAGSVMSESPVAGTRVNVGSEVNLVVSSGPAKKGALPGTATAVAAPTAVQWPRRSRASEIDALGKLYSTFGLNPPEAPGHAHPVPTEPVTVKPPEEVVPGFAVPQPQELQKTGRVQLDPALVEAKLKETVAVSALLAPVFAEEPVPALASRVTTGGCVPGLDEDTSAFVRYLATREAWSRGELERFASARALLLDGTLDAINEAALEACGALGLEGDDPVEVDVVVLTALIERTVAS